MSLKMFFQRQEVGKDGKLLTKAALTMPRDLSSSHLNQNFRLGFMQVGGQWDQLGQNIVNNNKIL